MEIKNSDKEIERLEAENIQLRNLLDKEKKSRMKLEQMLVDNSNLLDQMNEEFKNTSRALSERNELLEITLKSIGDGIITTDISGNITFMNKISTDLIEVDLMNVLGVPIEKIFRIYNETNGNVQNNPIYKALELKKIVELENNTILLSQSEKIIYISDSAAPIINNKGDLFGAILVFRDVSEKKIAKNQLIQKNSDLQAIVDAFPDLYFWLNDESIIINYSTKDKSMLFIPPEVFMNHCLFDIMPEYVSKLARTAITQVKMSRKIESIYYDLVFADGVHFFEARFSPTANNLVLVIIREITEKKLNEQNIKKLNEQLALKNKELEQIIYITSHDVRSPLVNILGFSKEIKKTFELLWQQIVNNRNIDIVTIEQIQNAKKDIAESFDYIELSTNKINLLINGLLKFSKYNSSELYFREIDINKLLIDVVKTLEFQSKQKNATIIINNLPNCIGDELMILQVFSNLIGNSLKYSREDVQPKIVVSSVVQNNKVTYIISDNGIGVHNDHIDKIFELFYRVDRNKQGDGIGLAIVKKIIERHHSKIWMESEIDIGTRVFFTLPLPE